MAKNPGTMNGTTTYHDAVRTEVETLLGVFGGVDVAIGDEVDVAGFLNFGEPGPICSAGIALFTGTTMDGEGADTNAFQHLGNSGGDDTLVIPTEARLHGNWKMGSSLHSLNDRLKLTDVAE